MSTLPPDFDSPSVTRGPLLIAISIAFFVLSSLFFLLRIYSRKYVYKRICLEEYLITAAFFINIFFTVYAIKAAQWGFGRKMQDYPPDWLPNMLMNCFIFGILYTPVLALTKISILVFFTRFAPSERFKYSCYGAMVLVGLCSVPFIIAAIFACSPIEASWTVVAPPTVVKCIDLVKMSHAGAISNSLTDVVMLCLPLPMVWKLKVSFRKKLAVCGVFSLGGFVLAVSLVRVGLVFNTSQNQEYFWDGALSASWSVVEVNTIIICACLPATRHLFFDRFGSRPAPGPDRGIRGAAKSGRLSDPEYGTGDSTLVTATWGTTTTDDNATKRSGQAKLDTDKKDGYVRVTEGEGGNQNATNGEVPTRK